METFLLVGSKISFNVDELKETFTRNRQKLLVYINDEEKIDIKSINFSDNARVIINAHGCIENNIYKINLSSTVENVANIFIQVDKSKPVNVELFSCYSGAAINAIEFLPVWSTLITFASDKNTAFSALDEEIVFASANFFCTVNPFIKFALFLFIVPDTIKFAIKVRSGNKIFISPIELLTSKIRNNSISSINELNNRRLEFFKKFCTKIKNEVNSQNRKMIDEFLSLCQEGKWWFNGYSMAKCQKLLIYNMSSLGRLEIVRLLIGLGVKVNIKNINGCFPLYSAIDRGHIKIVRELIKAGALVNQKNSYGSTALHAAAEKGHLQIIKELINSGASVNEKNEYGYSPLYYAISKGDLKIAKELIKAGALVNEEDKSGYTLIDKVLNNFKDIKVYTTLRMLIKAGALVNRKNTEFSTSLLSIATSTSLEIVRLFIRAGAVINERSNYGTTALHSAAYAGNLMIVKELIKHGAIIDIKDYQNHTPLYKALQKKNMAIVKELLKVGALEKVNDGLSSLTHASFLGKFKLVKELIKKGFAVNEIVEFYGTPLHAASKQGHLKVVKELIKAGALINEKVTDDFIPGFTPLHSAAESGYLAIVEELIDSGALIDEKNNYGRTPLYLAACAGHIEVVRELIKKGVSINEKDNYSLTLLHRVSGSGNINMVRELIKNGVEINKKTDDDRTSLYISVEMGHTEVVKELIKNGAALNEKASNGLTALDLAIKYNKTEIIDEFELYKSK